MTFTRICYLVLISPKSKFSLELIQYATQIIDEFTKIKIRRIKFKYLLNIFNSMVIIVIVNMVIMICYYNWEIITYNNFSRATKCTGIASYII